MQTLNTIFWMASYKKAHVTQFGDHASEKKDITVTVEK